MSNLYRLDEIFPLKIAHFRINEQRAFTYITLRCYYYYSQGIRLTIDQVGKKKRTMLLIISEEHIISSHKLGKEILCDLLFTAKHIVLTINNVCDVVFFRLEIREK